MNYEELDACVRGLRNEMIDFTCALVGIASENPPGAKYVECVRAIAARLRAVGLPSEVVKYRPRNGIREDSGAGVVLSSVGVGKRTLYFSGGMPAYAYGPGLLSISHGPKEFVDTRRIVDCAAIYARVAAEVLKVS
jgi:acetylornithine deacetylase/succinyl-diaminopimelate desuccinylase-like protein